MLLESPRSDIAERLIDLEAELRQLNLWAAGPPPPHAFKSEQPFAMDQMSFEQWLQFIFLPTLYQLLDTGGALPKRCAVTPMAEETLARRQLPTASLIATLKDLDQLITETD